MPRRKTTRVKRRSTGERGVNLHARTGAVVWSQTKRRVTKSVKWLVALAVLFGAGFAGKEAMREAFLKNEEFNLREVQLQQWDSEESPHLVDLERLVAVTGLDPRASIFAFNLGELEDKLEALPEVKQVRATRRLPNVVRISIEERKPVAWLDCPGKGIVAKSYERGMLVDGEGVCMPPSRCMEPVVRDLPVIASGERDAGELKPGVKMGNQEMLRALELVKLSKRYLSDSGWQLPVVGLRNEYSLMAKTHMGTAVTFGLYDHERQLEDLLHILDHARKTARGVERVNVIPERNIPVVFVSAESASLGSMPESRLEEELDSILKRG